MHRRADREPFSPRLFELRQRLESGDTRALAAFWERVADVGTPLVEEIEGDDEYALLTFLWRETGPIASVVITASLGGPDRESNRMTRLPGSNVWYRTYRVRNDLRALYKFIVSSCDTSGQPAGEHWGLDPLNPRVFETTFADLEGWSDSVVELPGTADQPWVDRHPDTPTGDVTLHRLPSAILGRSRRIWTYTPAGYSEEARPYPLLLLLDGQSYVAVGAAPTTLDNLIAANVIPPIVAVMVSNVDDDPELRLPELSCSDDFCDVLAHELIPWIRSVLNVTDDPGLTIVGGSSLGGLFSAFTALQHPDIFGCVLSQSGSFWWRPEGDPEHEWLARQFATAPRLPLRFYLEVGLLETDTTPGNGPTQVVVNRHLRDVLKARDYPVAYVEYNGGHNFLSWRGGLAGGLLSLIGKGRLD